MKTSESHFHEFRGLTHHVRTWGRPEAPALFLLHGWMDVSASFQFVVDSLRNDWRVVAPDWRGFGLSGWTREGYWFPDYYADLERILDIYAGEAPARLVGHSMGGVIAGIYSGIRPARIARLAILEGLGLARRPATDAPLRYAQWLDDLRGPPRFRPYAAFEEVAARLRRDNPRLTADKAAFLARYWAKQLDSGEVVLVSDPRHKMANPVLWRIEEAVACWKRVTAPVLLVTGKDSNISRRIKEAPEQFSERTTAFANRREVTIEECGHMMHHDQPERLAALLEEFFVQ